MDDFTVLEQAFGIGAGSEMLEGDGLDGLTFRDSGSLLPGLPGDISVQEEGTSNAATQPGLSSFSLMGAEQQGPSGVPGAGHQQGLQQAIAHSSPTGMGSSDASGAAAAGLPGAATGSGQMKVEGGATGQETTTTTTTSNASKRSRQQAAQEPQQEPVKRQSTRLRKKPSSLQDDKMSTPLLQAGSSATPREGSSGRGTRGGAGLGSAALPAAALLQADTRASPAGPPGMPGLAPIAVPPASDTEAMRMQAGGSREASTPPAITELELKQAYCNSVQSLKDYITVTNLLSYDISGKNLPDKITTDLKMLIHHISKVCLQAIKPDTPFVINVISKDYSSATTMDWELDKSHWINVIGHLQLSDVQVMAILRARAGHVDKLINLYNERAALARHAAELATASSMQPHTQRMGIEEHSVMGVLMRHGYLYCARNVVTLHRYMELLRESLNREQKIVMELFLKVVYQVLSPVQAALFVVESFPYHCDVLALANVLSMAYTRGSNSSAAHADPNRYNTLLSSGTLTLGPSSGELSLGGGGSRGGLASASSLPFPKQPGNGSGGGPPRSDGLARLSRFLDSAEVGPGMIPAGSGMQGMGGQLQSNSSANLGGLGLSGLDSGLGLGMNGLNQGMMGQGMMGQMGQQRAGLNAMNSGQLSAQGMQLGGGGSMLVPGGSGMLDTRLVSGPGDGLLGNGMGMGNGMQQGNRQNGLMNNNSSGGGGGGLSMTSSGKLAMPDSLSSLLSKELANGGEEVQGGGMMGGRNQQMGGMGRVPTPDNTFAGSPSRGMNGRTSRGGNAGTAASVFSPNWASGSQLGDGLSGGGFPGGLNLPDLGLGPQGGMPNRVSHPGMNSLSGQPSGNNGLAGMQNNGLAGMDFAQQAYRSFTGGDSGNGRNGVPGLLGDAGMPGGMDGRLGSGGGMGSALQGPNGNMGMGDGGFRQQSLGGTIMQGLQGMRQNTGMMAMGGGGGNRVSSAGMPGSGMSGAGPAITGGGALPTKSSLSITNSGDLAALWNMVGQGGNQGDGMQSGMSQQQAQQQQQQQGGLQQVMSVPPSGLGQGLGNLTTGMGSNLPVISVPQDTSLAPSSSQGGGKPEMSTS